MRLLVQAIELLRNNKIQFGSFDILTDEEVRQGRSIPTGRRTRSYTAVVS